MSKPEEVAAHMITIMPRQDTDIEAKPVTVSSTSSIDTSGSSSNDAGKENGDVRRTTAAVQQPVAQTNLSEQTGGGGEFAFQPILYTASSSTARIDEVPSSVSLVARPNQLHISPSTGVIVPSMPTTNTVPEFLYQLTKMLTDNNREIIEWSNGKIEVHSPHKLESHVLNRYFRHSKFASFQRQLNYFGFRKLAGKGKMAPCSYINDATTRELGSLLLIKRKTGNEPKAKSSAATKKRDRQDKDEPTTMGHNKPGDSTTVNPVLANILYRSSGEQPPLTVQPAPLSSSEDSHSTPIGSTIQPQTQHQALARVAVGRGIRHSYSAPKTLPAENSVPQASAVPAAPVVAQTPVEASLHALTSNYHNSLQNLSRLDAAENVQEQPPSAVSTSLAAAAPFIPGSLSRDDSLVDLAMIPQFDEAEPVPEVPQVSNALTFVDFPWIESSNTSGNETSER